MTFGTFGSGIFGGGLFGVGGDPDAPVSWVLSLTVGAYSWEITDADTVDPDDPVQVLDGLTIGWVTPESAAWPAQPNPATMTASFYVDDVDGYQVNIGDPVALELTDEVGTILATFHGRIAELGARPVKRGTELFTIFTVSAVDYTVDLAELPIVIDVEWPAESASDRFTRIAAAVAAAGGPVLDPPAATGSAAFEAVKVTTTNAGTLVADHLRQLAIAVDFGPCRYYLAPVVVAGVLDHLACVLVERTVDASLLPGTLDVDAGVLTLPDLELTADGVADACNVELDTEWTRLKFRATNVVTVAGDTVTAAASRPGPPVRLTLPTTLTDVAAAERMARLYLPDLDESNGWVPDSFRLHASRDLDAIVPSWFPDHRADPPTSSVYVMPIALVGIADDINLAGVPVYAGQLTSVSLTLEAGRIFVAFALRRQLPLGIGAEAASWDWLGATFPTITWGDVDPGLSWYEARLARRL